MAITIAIPFYNAEAYLADAIKSVFAQTYQHWELILIDDGSTDRSLQIATSVKDTRVRVVSDGLNKKLASRLNEIAQLATYPIIARMDADDLMATDRLEKQLQILNNNPTLDLVTTGVYSVTNTLKMVGARGVTAQNITLKQLLFKEVGVTHAAMLGKKDWFIRNPYDTSLKIAQDYELWLRASAKNDFNIQLVSDPLYYYREEGNATMHKLLAAYKNERRMYKKYAGKYYNYLLFKSYLKAVIVYVLGTFGKLHILLNKRSSVQVSEIEMKNYKEELQKISQTHVPGLIDFKSK
jgi:glycosyltransferase involved in cell wall biosynthesis